MMVGYIITAIAGILVGLIIGSGWQQHIDQQVINGILDKLPKEQATGLIDELITEITASTL